MNIFLTYYLSYNTKFLIIFAYIFEKKLNLILIDERINEYQFEHYKMDKGTITFDGNVISKNKIIFSNISLDIREHKKRGKLTYEYEGLINNDKFKGDILLNITSHKTFPFSYMNTVIVKPNKTSKFISILNYKTLSKEVLIITSNYNSFYLYEKKFKSIKKTNNNYKIKTYNFSYNIKYEYNSLFSSKNTPIKIYFLNTNVLINKKYLNKSIDISNNPGILIKYQL